MSQAEEIRIEITGRWVPNHRLSKISLKYTSRISDLRRKGFDVKARKRRENDQDVWEYMIPRKEQQGELFFADTQA